MLKGKILVFSCMRFGVSLRSQVAGSSGEFHHEGDAAIFPSISASSCGRKVFPSGKKKRSCSGNDESCVPHTVDCVLSISNLMDVVDGLARTARESIRQVIELARCDVPIISYCPRIVKTLT